MLQEGVVNFVARRPVLARLGGEQRGMARGLQRRQEEDARKREQLLHLPRHAFLFATSLSCMSLQGRTWHGSTRS